MVIYRAQIANPKTAASAPDPAATLPAAPVNVETEPVLVGAT